MKLFGFEIKRIVTGTDPVPVPEAPVAEVPVPEAPVAEVPVPEAPVPEAPVAEVPVPNVSIDGWMKFQCAPAIRIHLPYGCSRYSGTIMGWIECHYRGSTVSTSLQSGPDIDTVLRCAVAEIEKTIGEEWRTAIDANDGPALLS